MSLNSPAVRNNRYGVRMDGKSCYFQGSNMQANAPSGVPAKAPSGQARKGPPIPDTKAEDASIWRDTALRYGGYADEVGEFASPYLGGIGRFVGYGVSTAYCIADMFGSTLPQKYRYTGENGLPKEQRVRKTLSEALDLGLFHGVATLWIPPMLIGTVVEASDRLLDSNRAHASEPGGDPIRGFLERGMDKLIRPFQRQTANKVDAWLETTGVDMVSGKPLQFANTILQRHRGQLEGAARFFANLASGCERIPGLKSLIGAEELHRNATDIGKKTAFQPKELAKLLLIKPIPVAIGVGMVPLIAHPFDRLMQTALDWTVRPLTGKNKLERGADGKIHSVRNPYFWHRSPSARPQTSVSSGSPFLRNSPPASLAVTTTGMHGQPFASEAIRLPVTSMPLATAVNPTFLQTVPVRSYSPNQPLYFNICT